MNNSDSSSVGPAAPPPASGPILDAVQIDAGIDRQRIARRAYELWQERRDGRGHADADWFQAEFEEMVRQEELRKTLEEGPVTRATDGLPGIW